MTETIHASCIAIGGRAVLLAGGSGAGKSDLALRLMDRGAQLVSDDYTELQEKDGRLIAAPPATIAGKIEMRGVGILDRPYVRNVPASLFVDIDRAPDRMPEPAYVDIAGVRLPSVALNALEASAPLKVEAALTQFGLKP